MIPGEEHIIRLSDHLDARVALDGDLDVVVTIRGIGGSEPYPYVDLTLDQLRQLEAFARLMAAGPDPLR